MELKLRKYGNRTVLPIPSSLMRNLGLQVGQTLKLTLTADGLITLTPKRRHTLSDLIAQCDLKAPPPADMRIWEAARPIGQEVF
jgi:antitoxin ChpS